MFDMFNNAHVLCDMIFKLKQYLTAIYNVRKDSTGTFCYNFKINFWSLFCYICHTIYEVVGKNASASMTDIVYNSVTFDFNVADGKFGR